MYKNKNIKGNTLIYGSSTKNNKIKSKILKSTLRQENQNIIMFTDNKDFGYKEYKNMDKKGIETTLIDLSQLSLDIKININNSDILCDLFKYYYEHVLFALDNKPSNYWESYELNYNLLINSINYLNELETIWFINLMHLNSFINDEEYFKKQLMKKTKYDVHSESTSKEWLITNYLNNYKDDNWLILKDFLSYLVKNKKFKNLISNESIKPKDTNWINWHSYESWFKNLSQNKNIIIITQNPKNEMDIKLIGYLLFIFIENELKNLEDHLKIETLLMFDNFTYLNEATFEILRKPMRYKLYYCFHLKELKPLINMYENSVSNQSLMTFYDHLIYAFNKKIINKNQYNEIKWIVDTYSRSKQTDYYNSTRDHPLFPQYKPGVVDIIDLI